MISYSNTTDTEQDIHIFRYENTLDYVNKYYNDREGKKWQGQNKFSLCLVRWSKDIHLIKSDKLNLTLNDLRWPNTREETVCPCLLYTSLQLTRPLSHKPRSICFNSSFQRLNCPAQQKKLGGDTTTTVLEEFCQKYIHEPQNWLQSKRFININHKKAPVKVHTSSTEMGRTIRLKNKRERPSSQQKITWGNLWTLFIHSITFKSLTTRYLLGLPTSPASTSEDNCTNNLLNLINNRAV